MIGDEPKDIIAGKNACCKTILLDNPSHSHQNDPQSQEADYKAVNMKEAVNIIKQHQLSSQTQPLHPKAEQLNADNVAQPEPAVETQVSPTDNSDSNQQTTQLLHEILEQLKFNQRTSMFNEFSVMRMLAGIAQISALSGFGFALYLFTRQLQDINNILLSLSFAIFLQLMALTFYIMNERK